MLYRRPPVKTRRNMVPVRQSPQVKIAESDIIREIEEIPLPNENEKNQRLTVEADEARGAPPINILGRNIFLDDIIIFGLIFLLLQEQIEDEFLLILLVYILLI